MEDTRITANGTAIKQVYGFLQQAPMAVCVFAGPNHVVEMINKRMLKIWGRKLEDVIQKPVFEAMPDISGQGFEEILDSVYKTGQQFTSEERPVKILRNGNIENIYVRFTCEPYREEDGTVSGVIVVGDEISEKKLDEKNRAMLAAIVQSSDDAIISKTVDRSIITSWNAAAERIFGYTAEEMIGESILKLIPEDKKDDEPLIIEKIKKGEPVEHFETKRVKKDGTLIDVSLTISPIKDINGYIIGASKIARDITSQKAIERRIRENEERMKMVIESSKLGTWEYDTVLGKLFCSDECRKMCGLPADVNPDLQLISDHIYSEDKDYFFQHINAAIDPAGDGRFDLQLRIYPYKRRDITWIRAQGKVFFNSAQQPERLIGVMLDINEEKAREQELLNSVELFQTMADNVPAMIWMSGTDKFNDYFNKTWLEFTGQTLEQESNEGWLNGLHPDDVKKCVDTYNRSLKNQKAFYSEYRLRRHDGQYRWIADNSIPRFSQDGNFLGFISACMDIDDQKRFREKVQASELLFKTISSAAPVGLWMTDVNGQNTFVNATWEEWTGIPFEKQLGTGWLDSVLEEDKINATAKFQEALEKEIKYNTEFRIVRKDGETRWCLTEGYPYYDANGKFAGYAGSVTDITDIKRLEQRKDDFIKMASHELKTPITSINGYVQLLLNIYNEFDDEKLQASRSTVTSSLGTVAKQVSKLTRLISDLLDMSKIESDKLELHTTEFDLSGLIEETVQDMRYATSRHAIVVQNDFEGNIVGDKDRLAQVLMNLLNNAIKYSPHANKVDVYTDSNGEKVNIHVRDYGIGIDKNEHKKIFDRFYRVGGKAEQTYPGFGIGLFIASEIIHRHNGSISVDSEKDNGSVFTVSLPIKP